MSGDIASVAGAFDLPGPIATITPHTGGHINASYLVTCGGSAAGITGAAARFLLQRINPRVFPDPAAVMHNVARVLSHIERTVAASERDSNVVPRLLPTCANASHHRDGGGLVWRMFRFIDAVVFESVTTPELAFEAARAFGSFQRRLRDLPPDDLIIVLPDFHHTPKRLDVFEQAVARDAAGRAGCVREDIARIRAHADLAAVLQAPWDDGRLPTRIAHNDAKITNVLFHASRLKALCVVDLDTVMPGLSLHDFGDMMRSMLCPCREDEPDLIDVEVCPSLFDGLVSGYLSEAATFLTPLERELLVASGQVITFEQAARFLADYLNGDVYYRIDRPAQNLDRARVQLRLLESMIRQEPELRRLATLSGPRTCL